MALNLHDATAYAMRGLAFQGAPQKGAVARKYALTTTTAKVTLPLDAKGNKPTLMRFSLPAGALVYAAVGADAAVVPTTTTDGSGQILDGDTLAPWGETAISLVAEANATITITYLWL